MTIALALAALAIAGVAVALGIRVGSLKAERDGFRLERDVALKAIKLHEQTETDLHRIVRSRDREIRSLYEEIESCGDDDARSRAAIAGIRGLLSSMPEVDEDADTDPG